MDHQKYKEFAHLSVFGELNKVERIQLEEHLNVCVDCREEMESLIKLKGILNRNRSVEADDNMLNEARQELRSALRKERTKQSFFSKYFPGIILSFRENYKIALGGLTVLLAGIFIGYLFFKTPGTAPLLAGNTNRGQSSQFANENIKINNIRFIDQDASDGEVEFVFDAVKPMRIKGRVDDDNIKSILTYSMLNEENPGTRLNSLNLINSKKSEKVDDEIKSAVIDVVRYDENAGVRREAFKLLTSFPYDEEIKQAYLYVLMNDSSTGLRVDAMKALVSAGKEGFKFNEDDLSVFKEKMRTDENNYIRYYAKTVLKENN